MNSSDIENVVQLKIRGNTDIKNDFSKGSAIKIKNITDQKKDIIHTEGTETQIALNITKEIL